MNIKQFFLFRPFLFSTLKIYFVVSSPFGTGTIVASATDAFADINYDGSTNGRSAAEPWPEFTEDPFSNYATNHSSSDPFKDSGFGNGNDSDFPINQKNGNGFSFHAATDESKRQESIQELIVTEENYMADMKIVKQVY